MEFQQDSFYVTLLSNASIGLYPSNTLSKFTVKMPQVLNFPAHEKWECGVVNMSHSSITTLSSEDPPIPPQVINLQSKPPITIKFQDGHQFRDDDLDIINMFQSNLSLIEKLKNIDYSKYSDKTVPWEKTNWNKTPKKTKVNVNITRKFYVRVDYEYTPENLIDEMFSQIPFTDRPILIDFFKTKTEFDEFPEIRSYFAVIENKVENKVIPPKILQRKTQSSPDYLCCYCDLIFPQIVGDQLSRLLLMMPIRENGKQALTELSTVQYCAVEKNRISEISFLITDRYSEQIQFEASEFMTRVLLHFKKGYINI